MSGAPSLLSLCMKTIAASITHGYEDLQYIIELPSELLDALVMDLSPLALQTLHEISADSHAEGARVNGSINPRKRGRYEIFDIAWKELFKKRWAEDSKNIEQSTNSSSSVDWHQLYWEKHLQECIDGATETALLPNFCGYIGEIEVPGTVMDRIGHIGSINYEFKKLWYHCKRFGCYARCLRLQNVICARETSELLRDCKLKKLTFVRIIANTQVEGACMLVNQNNETLLTLEFTRCHLCPGFMERIYNSICKEGSMLQHRIQNFSVKSSRFSESNPSGLISLLSSGRDLKTVHFCDTKMQAIGGEAILDALLSSPCDLLTLEISESYINGWLSNIKRKFNNFSSFPESATLLKSLSVLKLRGNCLEQSDMEDLSQILVKMPNLTGLNISDNPIRDDGIRYLIPFCIWALEKEKPILNLEMENCSLTGNGVNQLLSSCLPSVREPLHSLSFADNPLGSSVTVTLVELIGKSVVREFNIEDIGLEELGFRDLAEQMPEEVHLSCINISKNRGKLGAANFLSKLISKAPNLVSINAASNLMPPQSLPLIYNSFKQSKGKLERLDLRGNPKLWQSEYVTKLMEIQHRGKQVVILPSPPTSDTPYDDDP